MSHIFQLISLTNYLYFQERNLLLEELLKHQQNPNNESQQVLVHVETDRVQITLLEGKIKEVLTMLKSLNSMVRLLLNLVYNLYVFLWLQNISPKTLGKLVLDAVDRSVDPLSREIQVFQFLNHLYHSAREYERISAETMIHNALQAVEAHSATLAQIEAETSRASSNTTTTNESDL